MPDPPVPEAPPSSLRKRHWLLPAGLLALALLTMGVFSSSRPHGRLGRTTEAEPLLGGSFRFPMTSPLTTLDPALVKTPAEIMVTQQIFEGLTAFDEHLNIVPALARYWEISEDSRIYTFELRPTARFHNGRAVTADDCVFSFERLLRPELNQSNYHYFSRIEGAAEFHAGRAKRVTGLRAIDPRTFQIRFATAFVPSLSVLSMYCAKILPRKEVEERGGDFFKAPIGAGAFRFGGWIAPDKDPSVPIIDKVPQAVRLEANPDYFRERPYLDEIVFRSTIVAKGTEDKQLDDIVDCLDVEPGVDLYDWVPVEAPQLLLQYILLPTAPPYNDPRVRRAINYALDKASFVGARDEAMGPILAGSIVPPGIPGFIPAKEKYEHNIEKARTLLAEAGFPEGRGLPPLEFVLEQLFPLGNDEAVKKARRGCFAGCLGRIGVKVTWLRAAGTAERGEPLLRKRPILLWRGWLADFPDPDNFLRPLFHSSSPNNLSGYHNPDVDRLLDEAWAETSQSARIKLYREVEKRVLKDSPIIPVSYGRSRVLLHPNVRGFALSPLGFPYSKTYKMWLANQLHPKVRL